MHAGDTAYVFTTVHSLGRLFVMGSLCLITVWASYEAQRAARHTTPAAGSRPIVDGMIYATDAASVGTGGYATVVTLGSFKLIKVDASFGAIHAGDLLTTSVNPGHAMKVADKLAAMGAVIGKALADFETGSGTIPVLVTLK